jgi:raffinose/stachyose/melibiose transport system permease protein
MNEHVDMKNNEGLNAGIRKLKLARVTPGTLLAYLVIFTGGVLILYPLFWMVVSSMKSYDEIYNNVWGFPEIWHFENYKTAWDIGISGYFINSVIVTFSTVLSVVLIASMAAYGLTRYKSRLVNVFLIVIMAGMMINPQVALIPLYTILRNLGILNTRFALILPYIAFRLPLSVLLIRSYFLGIPKEVEESAIIDGCGDFGIFFKIYLPMSHPIIMTTVVLATYYAWNEFLFGTIFIDSDALKTIPSGLMNFRDALRTDWGVLLSGMVIASLPMIILLILLQKHLVRGLSEGSVKG